MFSKIADIFKSSDKTIIWEREYDPEKVDREMVYRYPDSNKQKIEKYDYIGIRDYEEVIYFQSGRSVGSLSGGHYKIEKEAKNSATEIIWVDPGIIKMTWGVGWHGGIAPRTDDGFAMGSSGDLSLRIVDAEALIHKVVVGKPSFTDNDSKELIRGLLTTSLRDVTKLYTLEGFITSDREQIIALMRTKLADEFKIYGLELISVNILNVTHPPENQRMVDELLSQKKNITGVKMDQSQRELDSVLDEINSKEGQIKTLKKNIEELEMKLAMSEIEQDEFDKKVNGMRNLLKQREEEVKQLRLHI
ncbi:MAG: SPFH domain-containing protein [Candidatus Heimdallarchaeota archaeon]|nr:SPFH domain-containing protein [Candidatus Heimdallarchaeota archaeon]